MTRITYTFSALLIGLLVLLAACDSLMPTPTPTHTFTGPTIAPSPQPFSGPPTEPPPDSASTVGQSDPTAASLPRNAALPPLPSGTQESGGERVEVTAMDGTLLMGDLYQNLQVRQPGVLLLASDRSSWGNFPLDLYAAGFTVLSMELREEGGIADFTVMLEALTSGTADPAHIGVVGAGAGADLALAGCAVAPACDTVLLLSPLDAVLVDTVTRFNPRPLFQIASEEDADSYDLAVRIDAAASGDRLFQPLQNAGRGTVILTNRPDVTNLMIDWLRRQLTG